MSENRNISGPIWGLLIGGAIGSVIALLYAPKPGKELRSDINKKTNEIVQDGKKMKDELWADTKNRAGKLIESANSLLNSGKVKLVSETEKVKEAFKAGAEAYSEERTTIKSGNQSSTGTSAGTKSGSTRSSSGSAR